MGKPRGRANATPRAGGGATRDFMDVKLKTEVRSEAKNYIYEIYNNAHKLNFFNQSFDKIEVKNSNSLIYI